MVFLAVLNVLAGLLCIVGGGFWALEAADALSYRGGSGAALATSIGVGLAVYAVGSLVAAVLFFTNAAILFALQRLTAALPAVVDAAVYEGMGVNHSSSPPR